MVFFHRSAESLFNGLFYSQSLEKDCKPQRNEHFFQIFNARLWLFEDSATFDEFNFICKSIKPNYEIA